MDWQTSNTNLMLEKSMRFLWTKQSAILDNITNVETPFYKTKYVTFEETLKDRLGNIARNSTNPVAAYRNVLQESAATVHVASNESTRLDENGVNLTEQSLELSRNAFQLQYALRAIGSEYDILRAAIRG